MEEIAVSALENPKTPKTAPAILAEMFSLLKSFDLFIYFILSALLFICFGNFRPSTALDHFFMFLFLSFSDFLLLVLFYCSHSSPFFFLVVSGSVPRPKKKREKNRPNWILISFSNGSETAAPATSAPVNIFKNPIPGRFIHSICFLLSIPIMNLSAPWLHSVNGVRLNETRPRDGADDGGNLNQGTTPRHPGGSTAFQ